MRRSNEARHPIAANVNGSHQVEPQQRKISQVILRESLARQMRVKTSQATKSFGAHTHSFQVGQNDASSVSNHHVFDVAVAIHQYANLPMNFMRGFRQLPRKFLSDDLPWWDSPRVELFKTTNLLRS
jgi:hypothetical protein